VSGWFPRVTAHSLAILISILIYILTTRAIGERRPPSIAIAWVLGMIAMPYAALPMYLMFGRRKLPRKKTSDSIAHREPHNWAEELIESFELGPASDAVVRLHRDGNVSAAALFEVIRCARFRLDICTYILGNDPFGHEAMGHMAQCVERGVAVRLLLDGVGAIQLPRSFFVKLETLGIQTQIFSPLFARRTQGPRNLRNHRKMVIADCKRLWGGGRNIAAEYFIGVHGEPAWRDLSFDLEGPVAGDAAQQFEADWVAAGGSPAAAQPEAAQHGQMHCGQSVQPGALCRAQFLPSGPDQTEDTVHALLIDACFHVRDRILAVTPYFVPDASLETALRLAARRGVKIDLVLPAKSNHILADFARNRALRSLHNAGVAIHLLPFMNHAKAVVCDESLTLTGSVNLDSRSLLLNYESAVVLYGAAEIRWVADWIEALMPQAKRFDARPPNVLRDICEGLLLTVAYQL
jgi:cardiolipin synthase A/B